MIEQLQQQMQVLQQDKEKGVLAANLMSQMVNSGVVVTDESGEITIRASQSPSKFKPFEGQ